MDFEFPFYRASVDEGLGLASEGNYEYTRTIVNLK